MTFDDTTYSECKLTESPMVIIDQVKMKKILEAKFKFRLSVFFNVCLHLKRIFLTCQNLHSFYEQS